MSATRLLNSTEAASFCGLSRKTLEKWRVTGEGPPFVKLGRSVRYNAGDLEEWLASRRRTSTSDPGVVDVPAVLAPGH